MKMQLSVIIFNEKGIAFDVVSKHFDVTAI